MHLRLPWTVQEAFCFSLNVHLVCFFYYVLTVKSWNYPAILFLSIHIANEFCNWNTSKMWARQITFYSSELFWYENKKAHRWISESLEKKQTYHSNHFHGSNPFLQLQLLQFSEIPEYIVRKKNKTNIFIFFLHLNPLIFPCISRCFAEWKQSTEKHNYKLQKKRGINKSRNMRNKWLTFREQRQTSRQRTHSPWNYNIKWKRQGNKTQLN